MDTAVMIKKPKPSQPNEKTLQSIQTSSVKRAVDLKANKSQFNCNRYNIQLKNGTDQQKADGILSKSPFPIASTCLRNPNMVLNDEPEHGSVSQQSISLSHQSTLESDINQPCHGHSCCKKLFAELIGLKKTVSAMYLMMLERNDAADENQENKINLDLDIKSQKQLIEFENKLKDPVVAAQYKLMVKRIGGKSYEKHIRNALNLTLSDELAYRMSWTGAKGTIMAKNMKHMEIIRDCIKDEWRSSTGNAIEAVIKSWLQHAGDRLRQKNN
ncbi:hypothetical protein PV326_011551 [Microctonus aethiopoides]|uniref:DUF4806 domain-containing protein n=1 Tax=Microctonus aethiopoides TaxID=144406 RepID=A0AA39FWH8_9HYME|nr:hypothetical protein PV326_011551 [Microctonus aethiopoides]KAK0177150.1 hypothetical protein PV328_001229 [Microctonus aethiopoides]